MSKNMESLDLMNWCLRVEMKEHLYADLERRGMVDKGMLRYPHSR